MSAGMEKYGKGSVVDISTVFGRYCRFLLKRPLKRDFTDIYRITFLGDGNLGNASARRVIYFLKMCKI